ncbi:glycosyltransferase family 4 protein [Patescibacteria group bacterium]
MKVVMLSWRDIKHPSMGGAEIATHEHAKYWAKNGMDVTVFSSSFLGAREKETLDGVKFVRRGNQLGSVYVHALIWYLRLKEKPDIVVDQIHGIGFMTPLYVRGAKRLAYIHEVAKEVWFLNHLKNPLNLIYGIIGYLFEPIMFKTIYRNTVFMTVSKSTKSDLEIMGIDSKKISVIQNGTLLLRTIEKKDTEKTAIFLGAIAKDKGIFDAIRCFDAINQKDPDWNFWVVGKGDPKIVSEFKKLADDLGVGDKVKYWGYVTEKKKFELLAKAHVMINPSVREGWGLVNIEANSCGTPVVGYDVPGVRDSITSKTGKLCKVRDWKCLAQSSINLTKDQSKYRELSANVVKWSENFTWKKSTGKSLNLLRGLLSQ